MTTDMTFAEGDHVVYPAHGVGYIEGIETQEVAGHKLQLLVISFEDDRMKLRLPVMKAKTAGLRKLSTENMMKKALTTLGGNAKISRAMWSRRAQEYEGKINSGNPVSIAEVIRDLHRTGDQPEQSYSERQLYQSALERLSRELAAIEQIDMDQAQGKLKSGLRAA
ncbi:MAG: CarD family transcriptional regulator [Alphaproteobacteria bacterium]